MGDTTGGLGPPEKDLISLGNGDLVTGETVNSNQSSQVNQDSNSTSENKEQSENQGKTSLVDFNNKYKQTDSGPFAVYVEHKEKNLGRLFPIRIGHYLKINSQYKSSIVDIKSVGLNRVKVILNSIKAANMLVNNEILTSQGYISYIPKFYTQRKGVVRMIDTYFTEDYLLAEMECEREVKEVKRMKKWVSDRNTGEKKLIDRQIIIVSFSGSSLPPSIRINGVIFPVEPYIYPVVQCLRCLRYGHISKQCKSTKALCKKCCGEHEDNTECLSDSIYCKYCDTNEHSPTSKSCPLYLKQKRIKQIMSVNNISFKEAENIEKNPSYAKIVTNNRFDVLTDMKNFPPLPQVQNTIPSSFASNRPRAHMQVTQRPQQTMGEKQSQQSNKKRRAGSPSSAPNAKKGIAKSSSVLPNPYRPDFISYKEKLSNQITLFINNLIKQILPDSNNTEVFLEQLKIEDTIRQYFSNVNMPLSSNNNSGADDGEMSYDEEY